ncbi:TIGR01777 family oxidoreductase [Actinocorallia lasiicapitis]
MKAVVSGASGLIGRALTASLAAGGWDVVRLVRREPAGPDEARWDPAGSVADGALDGADAVIHLAGAGIGDRLWTKARKKEILDSRVNGTQTLARAIAGLDGTRPVFVSGSAVGFYGDTGASETSEDAPAGEGFLADVVERWEAATAPAADAGVRTVLARTGIVLSADGGMLGRLRPLFGLGLGARLGDGRQWMSWITLDDEIRALRFLLDSDLSGPVNLTAPNPVTNAEFTRSLAAALHRPAPFVVPAPLMRLALRDFAAEVPLVSQRALPTRLTAAGFTFTQPTLGPALHAVLA